jgi:hypothetical protein
VAVPWANQEYVSSKTPVVRARAGTSDERGAGTIVPTATQDVPTIGALVAVRGQRWVVSDIEPTDRSPDP